MRWLWLLLLVGCHEAVYTRAQCEVACRKAHTPGVALYEPDGRGDATCICYAVPIEES